ncbi:type IX secretion system outer membrane channel protein PorV [Flavobacteriales bacterium]|nr:type IX secretion system outer membrane channel protein PorV [Flavobacteriales bacterium]
MKNLISTLFLSLLLFSISSAQSTVGDLQDGYLNTITTAVPFLIISPDARAGGMGDVGVASSPDAMSLHWNAAKYAFVEDNFGASVSYTPWLKSLIPDINLSYLSFYAKQSKNEVLAFSLRYFTLGEINFTDNSGNPIGSFNPNEFSLSTAYALKLSQNFSSAVSLRYIYSNLTGGQEVGTLPTKAGNSVAGDISSYYVKNIQLGKRDFKWASGINISNIGVKIAYTETIDRDFLPTNLRLGTSLTTNIDEFNSVSFEIDINKLLVPTPPLYNEDGVLISGKDPDVSVIEGLFQSFSDAPSGDREVRELIYALGSEYWYDEQFALRLGYFYEHPTKGDRQFVSLGAGLRYNVFGLDFSYLIPIQNREDANIVNPLSNTLRFALTFDFGGIEG